MAIPGHIRKLRKLARLLANERYRRGLRYGVAAAIEHTPVLRKIDCATVVDVGANVGQFALATRVCLPHASVIAFEPLAGPASVFRKLFASDPQVLLHQVALGPVREQVSMNVSSRIDSSSILPITQTQEDIFPGTGQRTTEFVQVETLAALLPLASLQVPALLKIDVQGFELQALRGCATHLERFQYVYVECSFIELYEGQALADEVVVYLRERGFTLQGIYNPTYDDSGKCVQGDFLLARKPTTSPTG